MSLLIRALKQAERDHEARVCGATPVPAEADRHEDAPGPALQLEPFDAAGAFSDAPQPPPAPEPNTPAGAPLPQALEAASAPAGSSPPEPPQALAANLAAVPLPLIAPSPASAADGVRDAHKPSAAGSFLASVMTAAAATSASAQPSERGGVRISNQAAGTAPPPARAPQPDVDADADRRRAASYLVAADPDRQRVRRWRMAVGATLGVVLAATAIAYWQYGARLELPTRAGFSRSPPAPDGTGGSLAASQNADATPAGAQSAPARDAPKPLRAAPHATPGISAQLAEDSNASGPARDPTIRVKSAGLAKASAQTPIDPAPGAIRLRPPEVSPEKVRALLQEAYVAAARGDTAAARKGYEHVIDLDYNNGDAWIGLATLAANSGDAANANRYYRHALEIDPSDGVALAGLLGLQAGVDPQEYESRLRQLLARDGSQAALQAALGKLLARQGRWLEAQEVFFQAWSADPSQADVAFNLAVCLERIRQSEAAVAYYRRALALTQDHTAHFDRNVARDRVAALLAAGAPGATADAGRAEGDAPPAAPRN